MNIKTFGVISLLMVVFFMIAGCSKTSLFEKEEHYSKNVDVSNPASVYCEEQGGYLEIEKTGDDDQSLICAFKDGSFCEEGAFFRGECKPGEVKYTTFSEEDLESAVNTIINTIHEWKINVEVQEISYLGDKIAESKLDYCKGFNSKIEECVIFKSNFFIPEQDTEMTGAFKPNTTLTDYEWYLGRVATGEWEVLANGFD